jgi:predicted ATP-dependent endonuclease of OLD family
MRGRRTAAGTVLIDEPEMYLHPQAQRHFYDILLGLVEQGGTQVIYSTHSPVFADAARFEGLRLIRRPPGAGSNVAHVHEADRPALETSKATTKLLTEYDSARSEALFANAVLLVEGKADLIAVRGTAERMKLDLDARNLSVMECGGKTSIPFHARLCRALGIPVCALYDDDQWPIADDMRTEDRKRLETELARARKETADIEAALPDKSSRFVCSPTLEDLVGIGRSAKNKPLRMAEKIKAATRREDLPERLLAAVQRLDDRDPARVTASVADGFEVAPDAGGSGS